MALNFGLTVFGIVFPCVQVASTPCVRSQRASQKPSRPRLEGDRDPVDVAAGRLCLLAPTMQQPQQRCLIRLQLLCRVPLDTRNNAGDKPARLAHLDHRDQRAILIKSGERSAQVIRLRHGAPRRFVCSDDDAFSAPLAP